MTHLQIAIRQRLLEFQANTADPRWSSHSLNELFLFVESSGGKVGEVLQALYPLLGQIQLSKESSHFYKELATLGFTSFRESYLASNLRWMKDAVQDGCTAPQAFLAMYSLPQELLGPECVLSLFKGLAGTAFWSEAVANLEDETKSDQVREILREWLNSGIDPQCIADVKCLAKISS